jgi:hypothetical protein
LEDIGGDSPYRAFVDTTKRFCKDRSFSGKLIIRNTITIFERESYSNRSESFVDFKAAARRCKRYQSLR